MFHYPAQKVLVMSDEINSESIPVFKEAPLPNERHPVNWLQYIGEILARHRLSLPREKRSATEYGRFLSRYLGQPVDRNRISRAESGDVSVSFGVYAAYFDDMGVLPDIVSSIEKSDAVSMRYLILIEQEMKSRIDDSVERGQKKLNERAKKEKSR